MGTCDDNCKRSKKSKAFNAVGENFFKDTYLGHNVVVKIPLLRGFNGYNLFKTLTDPFYRVFHKFGLAKFPDDGSFLGLKPLCNTAPAASKNTA